MELEGKTAFVTGAARGIGQESACAFARAGANVVIVDLQEASLAETADRLRGIGVEVEAIGADMRDAKQVRDAVEATVTRFGRLDCAHNNAGVLPDSSDFLEFSEETAQRIMDVNYWGVFRCMQAQMAVMVRQGDGGSIVNTASVAGMVGFPSLSVYSASKAAVIGLTRTVALEYGARGIRINSVCPGIIDTPMVDPVLSTEELKSQMGAAQPIGRLGRATEIADAVVWLSSPRASFVMGACLTVDGGYTAQ